VNSTIRTSPAEIAHLIDHTLLKPEAARDDIRRLCREASHFGFAAVCVNPWNVPEAARMLRGSRVRVCTVVGFPLGATLPQVKVFEAEEAIKLGAGEIDMVINIGALKSGDVESFGADIRSVVNASHRGGRLRENLYWIRARQGHGGRRSSHPRSGWRRTWRQSCRRRAHPRGFAKDGRGWRDAHWNQHRRQDHATVE
jgi:hypothetical protein